MVHYTIHACPARMWYVEKYLIPSMLKQGIQEEQILLWNDTNKRGNLWSFVDSMKWAKRDSWHLQDDILLASNFKEKTEEYDDGIVAGFVTTFDTNYWNAKAEDLPVGEVPIEKIWWSFQCIRIPLQYAQEFTDWWYTVAVNDGEIIRKCINKNKSDDWAFYKFIKAYHPELTAYNIAPNIVNHMGDLLGGSVVNEQRKNRYVRSLLWDEPELITQLEKELNGTKNGGDE